MVRRKHAANIAGLITGLRFASKSLEPSLHPRSSVDQGLIMAGSFITGFLAGSTAARIVGAFPVIAGASVLRIAGVAITGTRSTTSLRNIDQPMTGRDDTAVAWSEVGADVLESVAFATTASHRALPRFDFAAGVVVAASTGIEAQAAIAARDENIDTRYLVAACLTATGLVGSTFGVFAGFRDTARRARFATGATGAAGTVISAGAVLGIIGVLGIGGTFALRRAATSIAASDRTVEIAYSEPPESSTVTGGKYSLVPFETLGVHGRRLVSEITTRDTIQTIMGTRDSQTPVRIFVGLESAVSAKEQVELAIQEMRRAGGFERSTIVAASPSGSGYVNYTAIEAAELMARGDIATVAIQYGNLPSMLSMRKADRASEFYGDLVKRIRSEINAVGREIAFYAYGESLGAWTSQAGLDTVSDSSYLIVDGALWIGTPHGSPLFDLLTREGVPVFDRLSQLEDYVEDGNQEPAWVFLNHDNDPVVKFTASMFHTMPEWFKSPDRRRGVNPRQRWLPGIAFWQGLIDTKNASNIIPGHFEATGHDYRADLASFVRAAFRFRDVTADQMERIERELRSSEIKRAENIAFGKHRDEITHSQEEPAL